jgi:hypothetical protein
MNMNGKLPSCLPVFLPYCDSHRENVGKKIVRNILPKDRPVQIFGILAVRELPFCLRYRSLGSLMPDNHQSPTKTKAQTTIFNYTFLVFNRGLSPSRWHYQSQV